MAFCNGAVDSKGDTLKGLVTVTKANYARRRFDVSY